MSTIRLCVVPRQPSEAGAVLCSTALHTLLQMPPEIAAWCASVGAARRAVSDSSSMQQTNCTSSIQQLCIAHAANARRPCSKCGVSWSQHARPRVSPRTPAESGAAAAAGGGAGGRAGGGGALPLGRAGRPERPGDAHNQTITAWSVQGVDTPPTKEMPYNQGVDNQEWTLHQPRSRQG